MKVQDVVQISQKWQNSSEKYDENIVNQLLPLLLSRKGTVLLNNVGYFEKYIWLHFNKSSTKNQLLSIILLFNYKFSNIIDVTQLFFGESDYSIRCLCVELLINLYQNLEKSILRKELISLINCDVLFMLTEKDRQNIFKKYQKSKVEEQYVSILGENSKHRRRIIPNLIVNFVSELRNVQPTNSNIITYLEKTLEFFVDLLSSNFTRKFIKFLFNNYFILLITKNSNISPIFYEHHTLFLYYFYFYLSDLNGIMLDKEDVLMLNSNFISRFRKICFKNFNGKINQLSICNQKNLFNNKFVFSTLQVLTVNELKQLCDLLCVSYFIYSEDEPSKEILLYILSNSIKKREYELEKQFIMFIPNYFTEKNINVCPMSYPKTSIDFLSLSDFFLRFYLLFRRNLFLKIKKYLEYNLSFCRPYKNIDDNTINFMKLNKNCVRIKSFKITEIINKNLNDIKFNENVFGAITIKLENIDPQIRLEWEQIKPGDLLYLLSFTLISGDKVVIKNIRGCSVTCIEDEDGNKFTGLENEFKSFSYGTKIIVSLDPVQYFIDTKTTQNEYENFSLLIKLKENQKKSEKVIKCLREILMKKDNYKISEWCEDVILGTTFEYDNEVEDKKIQLLEIFNEISPKKFQDIFEGENLVCKSTNGPFAITFPQFSDSNKMEDEDSDKIIIEKSLIKYPFRQQETIKQPKTIKFNYSIDQLQTIVDSIRNGITLFDGKSSTGKTNIIKEIVLHLRYNFPHEKTVVVSKTKLDRLYKLIEENNQIEELDLVKFELSTLKGNKFFEKKIKQISERLKFLLGKVMEIVKVLHEREYIGHSSEAVGYFFNSHLKDKIEKIKKMDNFNQFNINLFSYLKIFNDLDSLEKVKQKNDEVYCLFKDIQELRFLELIQSFNERRDYIIQNKAKILLMSIENFLTMNHNQEKNIQFDNLIVCESNSFFDFEILLFLINNTKIKRIILCGNENNKKEFQTKSLNQTLFKRLKRVNLSYLSLDEQFNTILNHNLTNKGFASCLNFIDVESYKGVGECCSFEKLNYNLGEAEYVVQLYMYFRLQNYDKEKILILTDSKGQKKLIKEIIQRRCKFNPVFDIPYKVATIEEYNGERKEFILVSLVKTKEVEKLNLEKIKFVFSRPTRGLFVFFNKIFFAQQIPKLLELIGEQKDYKLHLDVNGREIVVENVEAMGKFVFNLTKIKMADLKKKQEEFLNSIK